MPDARFSKLEKRIVDYLTKGPPRSKEELANEFWAYSKHKYKYVYHTLARLRDKGLEVEQKLVVRKG